MDTSQLVPPPTQESQLNLPAKNIPDSVYHLPKLDYFFIGIIGLTSFLVVTSVFWYFSNFYFYIAGAFIGYIGALITYAGLNSFFQSIPAGIYISLKYRNRKLFFSVFIRLFILGFLLCVLVFVSIDSWVYYYNSNYDKFNPVNGHTTIAPTEIIPSETLTPSPNSTENAFVGQSCMISGCSREICQSKTNNPLVSNCIYVKSNSCYATARCEKQPDGNCAWTQTSQLFFFVLKTISKIRSNFFQAPQHLNSFLSLKIDTLE